MFLTILHMTLVDAFLGMFTYTHACEQMFTCLNSTYVWVQNPVFS